MEPRVGNLYRSKGGKDTRFWYLLSIKKQESTIRGDIAVLLGLDKDMNIVSSQTYGLWALRDRQAIGHIPLSEISFVDDTCECSSIVSGAIV